MKISIKSQQYVIIKLSMIMLIILSACSSSNDGEQVDDINTFTKVREFIFELSKTGFENDLSTRADSTWKDGDKILLLFESKSILAYGDAVFSSGKWIVNYDGELLSDITATCKAYFFENEVSSSFSTVTLNEGSAIYEDTSGTYTLVDGCLSVNVTLRPKTGRICFNGYNHQEIQFSGISHYTSFNRFSGEYQATDTQLSSKVSGEYTPFCYGFFSDTDEPCIKLWDEGNGFKRYLSPDVFKPGDSGYLTIPSPKDHNGWLLLFE